MQSLLRCYYYTEPWSKQKRAFAIDAVEKAGHFASRGKSQRGLPATMSEFFGACNAEAMDLANNDLLNLKGYFTNAGMNAIVAEYNIMIMSLCEYKLHA